MILNFAIAKLGFAVAMPLEASSLSIVIVVTSIAPEGADDGKHTQ